MIAKPTPHPPDLGIHAETDELSATVNHVVLPDGPGSWVKEAKWDEYLLTLQNQADSPMTISKVWLVDQRGVYIESSVSPSRLESATDALEEQYRTLQISTAFSTASAVATSGLVSGAAAAGSLAAVGPAAALALPVLPLLDFRKKLKKAEEKENIEREFSRRKLISLKYSGRVAISGSLFFPIIPNPRAMVFEFSVNGKSHNLRIPLEKIAGMHEEIRRKKEEELKRKQREEAEREAAEADAAVRD